MTMKSIRSIFRRVQGTNKNEQSGDDLSRSSSITNLNAETKNKGALSKSKKSASKDRLDKISDKKNDKKALTRNNNKIDDPSGYTPESLQEIESLQRQLQEMANEKTSLALQLGEQKGHMHVIENEMLNLKKLHEQLNQENNMLRSRLKDVAHSPLSDNEKQQLLLESHRHHSSAPASIATNLIEDGAGGDITACPTPDWDKHSSSNVSEISVACLQDRINQMEETHYSTKEELQATVQELNDLQRQLTEIQQDNYQLLEEKNLMFDSLCRQTERLNESKAEMENLKQRLREKEDDTGQYESAVEREQNLLVLVKSIEDERDVLLLKQEQLSNELQEAINNNSQQVAIKEQLTERIKTLESALDAKNAEHKQLDQEFVSVKDQSNGMQIEIDRLSDLLENARTKIVELEQDRALSDKSELDELLDNARKEKDALESEVTHLKEQVARSKNESEKLKDQVSILQEECKVTRNNAKCTQSELEYKCEILVADKNNLNEQLQQIQEAVNGLQVQAQCQLEDKRQLSSVLSETQKLLSEAERRNAELESELAELKKLRKEENEEWEKFQNDLLTSVRVANDFKTEAQQDLQKMIMENKTHREKVRHLEAQIDKLRGDVQNEDITTVSREKKEDEVEYHEVEYQEVSTLKKGDSSKDKEDRLEGVALQINEDVAFRNTSLSKAISLQNIESAGRDSSIPIIKSSESLEDVGNKELVLRSEQPIGDSDEIDGKDIHKSKLKPGSKSSFFKKPKIFRNHKGYYVSGPNSLETQDFNQDSLPYENTDDSLPPAPVMNDMLMPTQQLEQPPAEMDVKESKSKRIFSILPSKQKTDTTPAKIESKKHLSSQEQKDLQELNSLYADIDPNIPEEFLNPEQKFIVQLKKTYDSTFERKKLKPVANKPKNTLAISKPLLTSVISNPKLKQIADDPTVRLVEDDTTKNLYNTSNVFYPITQPSASRRFDDIHASSIQFSYYDNEDARNTVETFKNDGTLPKSKSLNDLYLKNEELIKMSNFQFTRQPSTGSLTNYVSPGGRPSMVVTAARAESYASTFSDSAASDTVSLRKQNIYNKENRETLNELCSNIDPNLSESDLTNEQKFLRNMKMSMDEMGTKQTLRKEHKGNVKISEPTKESVWSNPKLASMIKNPNMPEVKAEPKENRIKKLFEKFKSKKNEPPRKIVAKKQVSQEDIVHVTTAIDVKSDNDDVWVKNKSESDLSKQILVEDNVKTSESTSSLYKSVISNSDLQKLIENRDTKSFEDESNYNSDILRPKEDFSTPKKRIASVKITTDQYSSDTASSSGSKRETIHRISSIPPTETFNTFVKQKISPNTQKITFDYDDLVASKSKDDKGNLKISIGFDSLDADEKLIKSMKIEDSEDVPHKSGELETVQRDDQLKKAEGVNGNLLPEETNNKTHEKHENLNQEASNLDQQPRLSSPQNIDAEGDVGQDLVEDSDLEIKPSISFRKPKPDQEYIDKLYKTRLSGCYEESNQPDYVGLNQFLEQSLDAKKSNLFIKHSPKYKKQASVPTRPPPPPPISANKRHLSETDDRQSRKEEQPNSERENPELFNTSFKFDEFPLSISNKDEAKELKADNIFDVKFKFEEAIIDTSKPDERQLKNVELAERLIREIKDAEIKDVDEPIYVKFEFEDADEIGSDVQAAIQKGGYQQFFQDDALEESIMRNPQNDDSRNDFLDVKFDFKEPFNEDNEQLPENFKEDKLSIEKPENKVLKKDFLDLAFSFKEPPDEEVLQYSEANELKESDLPEDNTYLIEHPIDNSKKLDEDQLSFNEESTNEGKHERRIGVLYRRRPPTPTLKEEAEGTSLDMEPSGESPRKIEELSDFRNFSDGNNDFELDNEKMLGVQSSKEQFGVVEGPKKEETTTDVKFETVETKHQSIERIKIPEVTSAVTNKEENVSLDVQRISSLLCSFEEINNEIKEAEEEMKMERDEFELIQPPEMFANESNEIPEESKSSFNNSEIHDKSIVSFNIPDSSQEINDYEPNVNQDTKTKGSSFTKNYFINYKSTEIKNDDEPNMEELKTLVGSESIQGDTLIGPQIEESKDVSKEKINELLVSNEDLIMEEKEVLKTPNDDPNVEEAKILTRSESNQEGASIDQKMEEPEHVSQEKIKEELLVANEDLMVEEKEILKIPNYLIDELKIETGEPSYILEDKNEDNLSSLNEDLKTLVLQPTSSVDKTDDDLNLRSEDLKLEERSETRSSLIATGVDNEKDLKESTETINDLETFKVKEEEELPHEEIQDFGLLCTDVKNEDTIEKQNDFIKIVNVDDVIDDESKTSFNNEDIYAEAGLKLSEKQEDSFTTEEITSGSLTLHKDKVDIKQFSYTLKISDRDVDQFGDLERESVQSSTSFSTEIDDSDPNFGSIMNTKSKHSRQSSTSSEDEIFRRLSCKLDNKELTFLRDVYRKYDVERADSPINDGDIALIQRAKLNSLSPDFEDNDSNRIDNDVFLDNSKENEREESDEVLTEMELELIRNIQRNREGRPVSDINEKDLKIINTIRQESIDRKRSRDSDAEFEDVPSAMSVDLIQDNLEDASGRDETDFAIVGQESTDIESVQNLKDEVNEVFSNIAKLLIDKENLAEESPIKAQTDETVILEKTPPKQEERTNVTDNTPSVILKSFKPIEEHEEVKITQNPVQIKKPPQKPPKKRNVKGFSSSICIDSLLNDDVPMTESGISFMKKPTRKKPDGDFKTRQSAFAKNQDKSEDLTLSKSVTDLEEKTDDTTGTSQDLIEKEVLREAPIQSESEIVKVITNLEKEPNDTARTFQDLIGKKVPRMETSQSESETVKIITNLDKEPNDIAGINLAMEEMPREETIQRQFEITENVKDDTNIENSGRDDALVAENAGDAKREFCEEPLKVTVHVTDGVQISTLPDTAKEEPAHKFKSLSKKFVPEEGHEEFTNKIFSNYTSSPSFGVVRAYSLSNYARKSTSDSSSEKHYKTGFGSLPRSKSIESPLSLFRNEAKLSLSNNKKNTPSSKSPISKTEFAYTYNLDTSKVYEPIYANYIELQKPKKPSFLRTTKPPVPSPRYEHISKCTDKIDSKENAFDRLRNINMEDNDPEKEASPISLCDDVRDKHNFTQLNVAGIDQNEKDDGKSDNTGTSSGAKPKKVNEKDNTAKTVNNLTLKTSSMEFLYDSEESTGVSEKSSLDKSYLDLFKSPEQVIYENLSESDKTKATVTTIHFFKSGDISSESSNASTQEDTSPNKSPNKVSYLRKKFEQGKKQIVVEEPTDNQEKLPDESQSISANHVLRSVPKASNLPQNVKDDKSQTAVSSSNSSLENLRKSARKSFESARSVFELKVKKQEASEEKICETLGNTNDTNNVEGSNHQTIP